MSQRIKLIVKIQASTIKLLRRSFLTNKKINSGYKNKWKKNIDARRKAIVHTENKKSK